MADRNLDDLHPDMKILCQKWLDACEADGLKVGISQTYRSAQEQNTDYNQGRTTPGRIITNAKGGESPHNCTLADGTPAAVGFDFFIYNSDGSTLDWNADDASWKKAISIGETLGMVSGSTFHIRDMDHFEIVNWLSYKNTVA